MKKLVLIPITAGLIFAAGNTQAKQADASCDSISSCMQTHIAQLPQGKLRDYPQYAYGNIRRFPRKVGATGYKFFAFSPRLKQWAAYDRYGRRVAYGPANGGADYCSDLGRRCHTPIGRFRIYSKKGFECRSSKFPKPNGGAHMPYCMFFHGGYAIHGSAYISNRNGSHGCIRVTTTAARWLHRNFLTPGTRVLVLPY